MSKERWPLPENWVWVRSADIAKVIGGGTPRADDERNFAENGTKWITPADLSGYKDRYISGGRRDLSERGLSGSGATLLPKGTVLFTSRAPVGYCAIAASEISTNQGFKSLVLEGEILPEYVRHYLLSSKEYAESLASGTTFLELSGKRMAELQIPLPPLPEQRRIVKKLDTLSARTTTARDHLTAIAKLVERFKLRTLSNEIFREEVPFRKLGEISSEVRYGTSAKCDYDPSGTPVLRIPNLKQGRIDHEDLKTAHFTEKDLEKLALKIGDVLVIRSNGSPDLVGRVALVTEAETDFIFAGYLIRMRFDEKVALPEYIRLCFQSDEIRGTIEKGLKSTSGVNNINSTELQALEFPMPEVDEQREIVDRIEMAFAKIDRLAEEALKALMLTDNLDQRILAKAFAGELVPQDPNDEPASKLLTRVQEARANAPKKPRKKPTKAKPMKVAPQERVLTDSAEWPETGLPFEDVANRVTLPHDELKDAVFALLEGEAPRLRQEFDTDAQIMKLIRVAS